MADALALDLILGPLNMLRDRALSRRAALIVDYDKLMKQLGETQARMAENELSIDAINSAISKAEKL